MEESGAYKCWIEAGRWCQDEGLCIIIEARAPWARTDAERAFARLAATGTKTIQTPEWGEVTFARVDHDLYGLWACSGSVVALAREEENELIVRVDPEPFRERLHLLRAAQSAGGSTP
ncbi:MAG: hypothetical protein AMXMBFR53_23500 [Gemmatimonadota bacterium]